MLINTTTLVRLFVLYAPACLLLLSLVLCTHRRAYYCYSRSFVCIRTDVLIATLVCLFVCRSGSAPSRADGEWPRRRGLTRTNAFFVHFLSISYIVFAYSFHSALHLHVNLLSSHRTSFSVSYFLVCHPASPCISPCIIWSFMDHTWHSVTPPLSVAVLCSKSFAEQWPHSVTPTLSVRAVLWEKSIAEQWQHSITPPLSVAVLCSKSIAEQWPHSVTPLLSVAVL